MWKRLGATSAAIITVGAGGTFAADRAIDPYTDHGTHYELDIKADIEQGERVEIAKDRAELTLKGWNDEYAIKIIPQIPTAPGVVGAVNRDFTTPANRPLLSKKMEYTAGDVTAFIEPKAGTENEFDIDFTLHAKPETNIFTYRIEGAEQFDFFYQPPLNEEYPENQNCTQTQCTDANGNIIAERPQNIIGSYAIYSKNKVNHCLGDHCATNTNYATGKIAHIYRPKAIDAAGAEIWAHLAYRNGILTVAIPATFLQAATYPIRVDPTFGFTSNGTFNQIMCDNNGSGSTVSKNLGGRYTSPGDGTITQINARMFISTGSDADVQTMFKVFEADGAGANSHSLVGETSGIAMSVTTTQADKAISGLSIPINQSTDYILVASCDHTTVNASAWVGGRADSTTNNTLYIGDITYGSGPDPWNITGTASQRMSVYATYTCTGTCTETFSTAGYNTWTAPTGVSEVIAACWGAGGGGGETAASGGGGGGGGAFASSTLSVTAGNTYGLWIGAGGTEDVVTWARESSFATSSCPDCVIAAGGRGTADTTAGTAGPTASSTGTTKNAGGAGQAASAGTFGGGGGGAGGPHGDGNPGSGGQVTTGGNGGSGDAGSGGAGGSGGNGSSAAGSAGTSNSNGGGGGGGGDTTAGAGGNGGTPGGGGGGTAGTGTNGGDGAAGQCTLTYTVAAAGASSPSTGSDLIIFE